MDNDIDYEKIALATSGATGADLANIVNEAALRAVRMGREKVLQEDLMESVEVVIAGKEKKDRILSERKRELLRFTKLDMLLQQHFKIILSLFRKLQLFQEQWVLWVTQCRCQKKKDI